MDEMQLQEVNWVDIGIITVIALFALIGVIRGFVREALSLLTWVTAMIVGILFYEQISDLFFTSITIVLIRHALAFVLLVLSTLILGGIINYLAGKFVKSTKSNVPDHIMGTFFGAAKGAAIISISVVLVNSFAVLQGVVWRESQLVPRFAPAAQWIESHLPQVARNVLKPTETP